MKPLKNQMLVPEFTLTEAFQAVRVAHKHWFVTSRAGLEVKGPWHRFLQYKVEPGVH